MALLPALAIGGSLLKGFLSGRKEKKEQEDLGRAAAERQEARQAQWDAGQARRGSKLDAIQGAIGNVGGALPAGAPDYSFDPEVLARMKEALPFAETEADQRRALSGSGVDQSQGMGGALLGGFLGGVGQAADTALLGSGGGAGPLPNITPSTFNPADILAGTPEGGAAGPVEPDIDWDEILRRRG